MATALSLASLYAPVQSQLDRVRVGVGGYWQEAFRLVYGPAAAPPKVGGKLLRPALCFLSAGACGAEDLDEFCDMATAMELLHLAALAHDDVVDSAALRRGNASLNTMWDNHTAVLGGDYLVAQALTVLCKYDVCAVVASALESIHEMAEGELIYFGRKQGTLGEEDCIRLSEKKTASLFAVACATPTHLLGNGHRDALHAYGMGIGTAFQLVDDMLDLTQDEATLGKPACGDLIEGKMTLPILYMREAMDAAPVARLDAMAGAELTELDRQWVRETVRATGALQRTEELARDYVARASRALDHLPPSVYTSSMAGIADFIIERDF